MSEHCYMCGDRIGDGTDDGGYDDRCQTCWNTQWMIQEDIKLAREVYDRYLLETSLHNKPDAFRQTLIELE